MDYLVGIIFLLGSLFGSFLNVCIYRLPRKQSVVRPASHCPRCKKPVPAYFNVPIIGYLILRGRCHYCRERISARYPIVELLTGIILVMLWESHGLTSTFFHYGVLMLLLLPISFIDWDTKLILNVLTFPGIVMGLVLAISLKQVTIVNALFGLLLGGGFLWFVGLVGQLMFRKESMGMGDVKLGAMIGAFMGPEVLIALFLSFFIALPVIAIGLGTKKISMGNTLPFGPFISLGATVIVFFGPALYTQYFSLLNRM